MSRSLKNTQSSEHSYVGEEAFLNRMIGESFYPASGPWLMILREGTSARICGKKPSHVL